MNTKETIHLLKMLERITTALEKIAECTENGKFWIEDD